MNKTSYRHGSAEAGLVRKYPTTVSTINALCRARTSGADRSHPKIAPNVYRLDTR